MLYDFILLGILLVASAFFSFSEIAFIKLTDAKVNAMVKARKRNSRLVKKLKLKSHRLLITSLIGNNVVNVGAASLATLIAESIFDSAVLGITTGVMTLLILVFGEVIPKSYANNHPERFASFAAPYLLFFYWIFLPATVMLEFISRRVAGKHKPDTVSEEELRAMAAIGMQQGTIDKEERELIERLFEFDDTKAGKIMTPKANMVSIDANMGIQEAAELVRMDLHTRFPVVKGSPENVIGFVHSKDIILATADGRKKTVENIMRSILKVPENTVVFNLLQEFQKKQAHMAVVVDKNGKTKGIVTLEDVLEELVGEITDEHDAKKRKKS